MKNDIFNKSQFNVSDDGFSDKILQQLIPKTNNTPTENESIISEVQAEELRLNLKIIKHNAKVQYIYSTIISMVATLVISFVLYRWSIENNFYDKVFDRIDSQISNTVTSSNDIGSNAASTLKGLLPFEINSSNNPNEESKK